MKSLICLLLIIPLCDITVMPASQKQRLSGQWQLEYIMAPGNDVEELYNKQQPLIQFDSAVGKVSGSTGCNRFSGPYHCSGNKLHIDFSKLALTRMACQGEAEGIFLDILKKVNRYDIYDDALLFLQDDVVIMRWKKKS